MYEFPFFPCVVELHASLPLDTVSFPIEHIHGSDKTDSRVITQAVVVVDDLIDVLLKILKVDNGSLS